MSLFNKQSILKIVIQTDINDLIDFSEHKIKYIDPEGIKGEWTANVDGYKLIYDFIGADELKTGTYILQPFVTYQNKVLPGEVLLMQVEKGILT